jgi:clan AA aspartic protease
MGVFKEEITLINAGDRAVASRGFMRENEIRQVTVSAKPDTGAWTLVINEEIRRQLGLRIVKEKRAAVASGEIGTYGMTEPVEILWKDRSAVQSAMVLPKAANVLLGALPLEDLDLYVDPVNQRLVGVHGDQPLGEIG